ncbi:uncharacterized protein LOC107981093 [Nasonia vitripennis]|uniref:C2H2-type domain-containing protein n=1 Tax=Nasonia vitripennis TaxID=7425 RepID=A0A7M7QIE8_NASVI|nr:uncharacterized protein LOC107981093 [Nasonia vitripennis]
MEETDALIRDSNKARIRSNVSDVESINLELAYEETIVDDYQSEHSDKQTTSSDEDAESIELDIVDEEMFNIAEEAERYNTSKDSLPFALRIIDKESLRKKFNVVKAKARMYMVKDFYSQPNCDKCAKPLIFLCSCKSNHDRLTTIYKNFKLSCKSKPKAMFRCSKCSYESKQKHHLNRHFKTKHMTKHSVPIVDKKLVLLPTFCGTGYPSVRMRLIPSLS